MVSDVSPSPRDMQHLHGAFGSDSFGRGAEGFARLFGTPGFLIGQTIVVTVWIALNVAAVSLRWDPYPFILLNLAFSLQAAYAAPLILLAQTRQAERDKALSESDVDHREALAKADAIDRRSQSDRAGSWRTCSRRTPISPRRFTGSRWRYITR